MRKELIRQEKLELLAQRFDHKTTMRQAWLNENQRLVSQVVQTGPFSACFCDSNRRRTNQLWTLSFSASHRTILATTYPQLRLR